MKKVLIFFALAALLAATDSYARGGFSSGGRGGFSGGRSFSSPSRSFSSPSRSYSSPSRSITTTTTTRSSGYGSYGGGYHPMMYPGFGMGYGYGGGNGLLTGLIIGNMMHPQGTTVYQGGGYGGGSALLYPDGRVVDQNGMQVGTYINGQFTAVQGGMVAQPVPHDFVPPAQQDYTMEILGGILIVVLIIAIVIALF